MTQHEHHRSIPNARSYAKRNAKTKRPAPRKRRPHGTAHDAALMAKASGARSDGFGAGAAGRAGKSGAPGGPGSSGDVGGLKERAATLLSRRAFLYGAAGTCAVAALGAGACALGVFNGGDDAPISYLEVPKDALTPHTDFEALESYEGSVSLVNTFDIPYGSLLWANDDSVAACLLPTESGSPLAQIALLYLGSGQLAKVVENSVGKADGFEIYDARATADGVIWTEANIMEGNWRIYCAPLESGTLGKAQEVDSGDRTYETPTLAAVGACALWQKIPKDVKDLDNPSVLMACDFSGSNPRQLYESRRRNATPIYADRDSVVITPRVDSPTVYHTLTRIMVPSGEVAETLTLPAAMHPLEAGFGNTGFMFSFADIYDYGDGISNLGTYVPFQLPMDGNYNGAAWFGFARTPSAAPAWAGNLLIVKSTYSVCGVDLAAGTYFALDVENGADTYGEYLASSGIGDMFVTYTNVDHAPVGEDPVHTCRVKVWAPVSA